MTIQDNDPVALTYGQLADEIERIEQIPTLSGAGAPTADTPAFYLGQGYLDTTNNKLYFCTEIDGTNGYTWVEKGEKYTAGTNVQISANNEISATDTTYSNFTGTDGSTAGMAGLVPAPATTDAGKFLSAGGTWDEVSGGIPTNATFWGASYDAVNNKVDGGLVITHPSGGGQMYIQYKYGNDIISNRVSPSGGNWDLISASWNNGAGGVYITSQGMEVSGTSVADKYRYITKVHTPGSDYDAANKLYVDTAVASAGAVAFPTSTFNSILEEA